MMDWEYTRNGKIEVTIGVLQGERPYFVLIQDYTSLTNINFAIRTLCP